MQILMARERRFSPLPFDAVRLGGELGDGLRLTAKAPTLLLSAKTTNLDFQGVGEYLV